MIHFREIYFDGVGYASREALEHIGKYLSVPVMANYIMSTRVAVDDVRVKFDETKLPVDKIQALFTSVEDRDAARKEIEDVPGIEITGALPMNLEINAAGVNKGKSNDRTWKASWNSKRRNHGVRRWQQ